MPSHVWINQNAATPGFRRAAATWQSVMSQPGWVRRLALLTFLLVIMAPILFVLFIAMAAAMLVFSALALANVVSSRLRSLFGRPDAAGRKNVRVIERID